MGTLCALVVRITLEAVEPIRLGAYPGSAFRGALMEALLQRFCANPAATSCQGCPLHAGCPVTGLVAPLREEHPRGQDGPRPFVLAPVPPPPPAARAQPVATAFSARMDDVLLQPCDCLAFDVTLLGTAIHYFQRMMVSLPVLETGGVGSRLRCLGGRRGRAHVRKVEALGLGGSVQESLYERDRRAVREPSVRITAEAVARQAEQLATDRLTLEFLTPTRLKEGGLWLTQPEPRSLILRLAERLEALEEAYGEDDRLDPQEARQINYQRYVSLGALASQIQVVTQQIAWVALSSYSSRQRRVTPIGGFVGQATYEGDLTGLRELLVWGEVCHVGKNVVKGDGCYRIVPQAPS